MHMYMCYTYILYIHTHIVKGLLEPFPKKKSKGNNDQNQTQVLPLFPGAAPPPVEDERSACV